MRKKLRVNPNTHLVCVPQDMVEDGMVGDVDSYPNAVTLTLVTPGANLRDVRASLMRVVEDIEQRIDFTERKAPTEIKAPEEVKSVPTKPAKLPKQETSLDELRARIKRGSK